MGIKELIEDLQKYLNAHGASPQLQVDGDPGAKTAAEAKRQFDLENIRSIPQPTQPASKLMKRVPARGPTTKLIDISHYDETIDFAKVKASGVVAVIMKATEGLSNIDKFYSRNRIAAKAAGLLFGSYHFFRSNVDPKKQIAHFFDVVGPTQKGELRHMLDLETPDGRLNPQIKAAAIAGLDELERLAGHVPLLYTGPYFADALDLPDYFVRYPLVIAHYGTSIPLVPRPWPEWTVHQYTDKGDVPGIPAADEDLDVFNGTFEELKAKLVA